MRNLFWGIVLVVFGVLFLLDNLDIVSLRYVFRTFWPLFLVAIGISIILRQRRPPPAGSSLGTNPAGTLERSLAGDLVHESNVFGDISLSVSSQNFKGGSLSTVFGDCNVDCSGARFAEGEHELRIHSVFGDSVISLPSGAGARIVANSLFGDLDIQGQHKGGISSNLEQTTPGYETSSNRMNIFVSKIFGDVRIA